LFKKKRKLLYWSTQNESTSKATKTVLMVAYLV